MNYWCSQPSPCSLLCGHFSLSSGHLTRIWNGCFKGYVNFFFLSQRLTCFPCSPAQPFPPCQAAASFTPALPFSNAMSLQLVACKQLSSILLYLIQNHPKSPLFLHCCLIFTSLLPQILLLLFPQLAFMLTCFMPPTFRLHARVFPHEQQLS